MNGPVIDNTTEVDYDHIQEHVSAQDQGAVIEMAERMVAAGPLPAADVPRGRQEGEAF